MRGSNNLLREAESPHQTYRARFVYPVTSEPIGDGAVVVKGNRVVTVGRWKDMKTSDPVDLGDVVLLPGLVNAHCHFDYTVMRGAILPPQSFAAWVTRINDLKRTLDDDAYAGSIQNGMDQALAFGTTTALNIAAFPEIVLRLKPPPLRVWWFLEMLDVRSRTPTEEVVAGAFAFFEKRPGWLGGEGLSPHAPYTASPELYRLAARCCRERNLPMTTHAAESEEEFAMFTRREGPLFDLIARLGRKLENPESLTPFSYLLKTCKIPAGTILAHMNHLSESDWSLLELHAHSYPVVHCPNSHAYFGRSPFPLGHFEKIGVNVCIGTDSLASNRTLSLFSEMRQLLKTQTGVTPTHAIEMATVRGAHAAGQAGNLGEISSGACADFITIPAPAKIGELAEAIVAHRGPVVHAVVDGILGEKRMDDMDGMDLMDSSIARQCCP